MSTQIADSLKRRSAWRRALSAWRQPSFLMLADSAPLDLRILGRTLLHAAAVGVAAGLAGAAFFAGLEYFTRAVLEELAGYTPLRADGETFAAGGGLHTFRPWLLLLLPGLGGLGCGLLTRLTPEIRGGGGDAMIEAFHYEGGRIRGRVIWTKALASMLTLGTGGAGGREGPTMQIGGALGALVGRALQVSTRERRVLMVAGVAAGISAVFRTPLGAALLAVEVLYRDGFESDALIPAVLASVVSYSVIISIFGESTLFAHVPHYPFVPAHLPLFVVLALLIALVSAVFLQIYQGLTRFFRALPVPGWAQPALGGLLLGACCTPVITLVGEHLHAPGQGLGLLGGGYGAVQMAISGSPWLSPGWTGVALLVALGFAKLFAASITIGSGGSAGDFAPSLAIGGLLGGAFGRAAALLFHDPRISYGAFALVGMGTFYGGIAHTPLSALVLVCELAGNYDLLVPLMLTQGIAFVALRQRALYHSQVSTQRDSPVHRDALLFELLQGTRVTEVMRAPANPVCFRRHTRSGEILKRVGDDADQEIFPVLDEEGRVIGLVTASLLRVLSLEHAHTDWTVAADLMGPVVSVRVTDNLQTATERMLEHGLRQLPVLDDQQRPCGLLDESKIAELYLKAASRAQSADRTPMPAPRAPR
ncbi:MAG TPA: chloride channel protein [Polyangiaceae bacterium]|nr:chloride channel protein [Polyangiaceae bacterium]